MRHRLSCSETCRIFPDQGSNPSLLHCQADSLPLSHQGSPCVCTLSHSVVSDSATPWTVAHQAPLSMEFSRQEYWSGLPFPGALPYPEIEPLSPALADGFFTTESPGKPMKDHTNGLFLLIGTCEQKNLAPPFRHGVVHS